MISIIHLKGYALLARANRKKMNVPMQRALLAVNPRSNGLITVSGKVKVKHYVPKKYCVVKMAGTCHYILPVSMLEDQHDVLNAVNNMTVARGVAKYLNEERELKAKKNSQYAKWVREYNNAINLFAL